MEIATNRNSGHSIETGNATILVEVPADLVGESIGLSPTSANENFSHLARCFNEKSNQCMNWPDGYLIGALLTISWAAEFDHLEVEPEVKEVETVFKDVLHFQTKSLKLTTDKSPQHQLDAGLSEFLRDNDGPHTLLVTYYAGHGIYREGRGVILHETNQSKVTFKPGRYTAQACWEDAEKVTFLKQGIEADILAIFDCCFASDMQRGFSEGDTIYEILSASTQGKTTPKPGPDAFTPFFIQALKNLVKNCEVHHPSSFNTFDLHQEIASLRDDEHQPYLGNRLRKVYGHVGTQHIRLAPLEQAKERNTKCLTDSSAALTLTVHFSLGEQPTNEQVSILADEFHKAFKSTAFKKSQISLRRFWWGDLRPLRRRPSLTPFMATRRMLSLLKSRKVAKGNAGNSKADEQGS